MLFDLKELTAKKQSDEAVNQQQNKQSAEVERYLRLHTDALNNINELKGRLPYKDEFFFIWTLKSFNTFTFIQYLINNCGNIDHLTITSYNMSRVVISAIMELVDKGAIKNVHIVLSDVSKSRFPRTYELLTLEADKRENVTASFSWNHSKVALAHINDNYYVIEGSGNFADNSRHEQYIFANSKKIYEFRNKWIRNDIH